MKINENNENTGDYTRGKSRARKREDEPQRKVKLKSRPFIKLPQKGDSFLKFIWYGIKLYVASFLSLIAIPTLCVCTVFALIANITLGGTVAGAVAYKKVYPELKQAREVEYNTLASMKDEDFTLLTDTRVFDKDGNQIGLINSGHFEYAKINDISTKIQNGYIAVEDKRFKIHAGVDWISIARASLALLKNGGEITQGGSSITQQLIKNVYLTKEQTMVRKLTEILLAPEVEKKYSKADIMEFYCNINFYGHRCYGVEAASKYYFGKSAKDVDWWEAALLIGLSNSPSQYDPVKHPEAAIKKRNTVLKTMCDAGLFDESSLKEYQAKPLNIVQEYAEASLENYQTSYAIHCATIELMKNDNFKFEYTFDTQDAYDAYTKRYSDEYNKINEEIRSGGYDIYTSLDSNVQSVVQSTIDNELSRFTEKQDNGKYAIQGAAVVVDNQTNYVVAIVGGRGTEDQFNRGYLSQRQPGSTIKPLVDYTPAFDTGEYYPSKIMNDHKFDGGPANSGSYRGNLTIREALNRSLNTVAWQVLQGIGIKYGLSYLGKMQFRSLTYADSTAEAISIGGFTNGVRVVDMAKGYSTLANGGVYDDRNCITSIVSAKDGELYSGEENKTQVYQEDSAYMITDVLKGTMDKEYGTGYGLDINGQQAAGKTGTTNSSKDAWFCGYTRYYTAAVWMGYDTPKPMHGIYGATYSGRMWQNIMKEIHQGLSEWDWEQPKTVIRDYYNPSTGERTSTNTGVQDLFSLSAEDRKKQTEAQRAEDNKVTSIQRELEAFENFYISSVEDTFTVDDQYRELSNKISTIQDDQIRSDFQNRAAEKYSKLQENIDDMQDAIKIYEESKAEESRAEESLKAEEADQKVQKEAIDLRTKDFRDKLKVLQDMEYQQEDKNELIESAAKALEKLTDLDEYDDLFKQLQDAEKRIETLPTPEEWKVIQESIAESIAESESIQESIDESIAESKEAERQRQLEEYQRSLIDESETEATEESPQGPAGGVNGNNSNNGLPIAPQSQMGMYSN